ncbi:MAG: alpha/beta hydrolase [Alphaproteobacteria bacterium]|nr:alpha/beta hydrolase [Alphaproteobacteria bacterium]
MSSPIAISGLTLEVEERGTGRALLFLHSGEGLAADRAWLDLLAARFRVIAPSHPGFGRSSLPDWLMSVDDLAYLYLDLAERFELSNAVLLGASFGGWIAAEMAVRSTERFGHLVLVDPLGLKWGGVTDRDIADMHAVPRERFLELAWADPAKGAVDYTALPETELAQIVRGQQAFARFGWKPYMHNPRLRHWLHRIRLPTLLIWGEQDRIVTPAYGERLRAALPAATMTTIKGAGHFPHWEQPERFVDALRTFID